MKALVLGCPCRNFDLPELTGERVACVQPKRTPGEGIHNVALRRKSGEGGAAKTFDGHIDAADHISIRRLKTTSVADACVPAVM
ncbi:MAG: hypothetical protein AB8G23_21840 [Myxococcota bacterium]